MTRLLRWQAVSLLGLILLSLYACTSSGLTGANRQQVSAWAEPRGWSPLSLQQGSFNFFALLKQDQPTRELTVYIEGDGARWITAYRPPHDPTPLQPLVLLLAEQDPSAAVAYLARPCQYLAAQSLADCSQQYWSQRRFAAEVVQAMDGALDALKQQSGAEQLRLVGYSGGGVIAALLAQRRTDVRGLITLAAPLALADWTDLQGLSPLTGSLDPSASVVRLPQALHYAGAEDEQVPAAVVELFVASHGGHIQVLEGFDHRCCWVKQWSRLLARMPVVESGL